MAPQVPSQVRTLAGGPNDWAVITLGGGLHNLMQWGPNITFTVQPLNYNEMDHETTSDWAHKEIAGAAIYREWVGENDEVIYLRGNLFPYRIGGLSQIELFESMRRQGIAQSLLRGDGAVLGWFVCDKLVRNHHYISWEGVGQQIGFEAVMARVPVPNGMVANQQLFNAGFAG